MEELSCLDANSVIVRCKNVKRLFYVSLAVEQDQLGV